MDARLDLFGTPLAGKVLRHLNSASKVIGDSTLPAATQELVKIRASQINGCGFCLDMHTKDARALGETEQRIYTVAAWRDAPFFSERERAALRWADRSSVMSSKVTT